MTEKSTVRSVTYGLLRSLGLTVIFGNPGSTEQPFLQEFPDDFTYVLALQEASAIAMADAFAQVTRRPALVNLHSSAGLGNALGNPPGPKTSLRRSCGPTRWRCSRRPAR
jgi:benzoylformate decarboxylase